MPNGLQAFTVSFTSLPAVTQFSIAIIVVIWLYFNVRYSPKVVSLGPTILTTIGIFATFLGIALGLSRFDASNIQASVPSLLEGLKTAFWASVFGVGAAVLIKFREFFLGDGTRADDGAGEDVSGADIVRGLNDIRNAITGGGDESLISQFKLARQDANDRLDSLRKAQTEALQKLSEMGSKALVEALRDVIKDFNQKITEQFGENFKELNAAVGRLLVWQEQYKSTLETVGAQIGQLVDLLGKAISDLAVFVEGSDRFSQTADRLAATLTVLESGERRLNEVANSVVGLLEVAASRIPQVEGKLLELTGQMTSAVRENQLALNAALAENASSIKQTLEKSQSNVTDILKTAADSLRENQKLIATTLNENVTVIKAAIQSNQQEMTRSNAEFNKQTAELIQRTKNQITELDRALSDELTKSLESLAKQLTAISERFANDYMPLADKLKRVVDIARST